MPVRSWKLWGGGGQLEVYNTREESVSQSAV